VQRKIQPTKPARNSAKTQCCLCRILCGTRKEFGKDTVSQEAYPFSEEDHLQNTIEMVFFAKGVRFLGHASLNFVRDARRVAASKIKFYKRYSRYDVKLEEIVQEAREGLR